MRGPRFAPPKLGPLGTYSQGKADKHDKGDLRLAVSVDPLHRIIRMDFGTELTWIGLGTQEARAIANALLNAVEKLQRGH